MRRHIRTIASALLAAGCSGGGEPSGTPAASPTPAPVAAPSPTPTPSPTPAPTPTPSPTPTATPTAYLRFSEILIFRLGRDVVLPSACGGFSFQGEPPAVLPVSAFGRGLPIRYVATPQVWSIGGEVGIGFDGRDGDPFEADFRTRPEEVAYSKRLGADVVRFSIAQPVADGTGLDYVRLASVWAPVGGVSRQYQCVTGSATLPDDLAASASGAFRRGVLLGTARVREGDTTRAYSLDRSVVTVSADLAERRVAISMRLIGSRPGAADVELGAFAASAPIDPATGGFGADLTGGRAVAGALSGRFFGPRAVEVGAALGASVPAAAGAPAFSFAGGVYGVR